MNSRSKGSSDPDCIPDGLFRVGRQVDCHHNLFDGKAVNPLTPFFRCSARVFHLR